MPGDDPGGALTEMRSCELRAGQLMWQIRPLGSYRLGPPDVVQRGGQQQFVCSPGLFRVPAGLQRMRPLVHHLAAVRQAGQVLDERGERFAGEDHGVSLLCCCSRSVLASSSPSAGVAATTPDQRRLRSGSISSGLPQTSRTTPPAAGTITIAAARSMIRWVSDPASAKASVDPSATNAASRQLVDRIRTRAARLATRHHAASSSPCGRNRLTAAPSRFLRPLVRYGTGRPAIACQHRPVSNQHVNASVAVPSTATTPANADNGTPAAALAVPSTGSTTKVTAEPLSTAPISSLSRFTPCRLATSATAVSTRMSRRMVGVPSAPICTFSARAARSYRERAAPNAATAARAAAANAGWVPSGSGGSGTGPT